eukprot:gene12263-biopygen10977
MQFLACECPSTPTGRHRQRAVAGQPSYRIVIRSARGAELNKMQCLRRLWDRQWTSVSEFLCGASSGVRGGMPPRAPPRAPAGGGGGATAASGRCQHFCCRFHHFLRGAAGRGSGPCRGGLQRMNYRQDVMLRRRTTSVF